MNIRLRNGTENLAALVQLVGECVDAISGTVALDVLVMHCKEGTPIDEITVMHLRKHRLVYPDKPVVAPNTKQIIDAMFDLVKDDEGHTIGITRVSSQA